MFDNLSEKLGGILDRLTRRGALSEADVDLALREVRRALLEADVSLDVARAFVDGVKKQAVGVEVMSVEGGAKAGFIAPDEKAYTYLKDKPKAPKGKSWDEAMRYWETLHSDDGAHFDREIKLDAAKLPPLVTWGTSPEQVIAITGRVPIPSEIQDEKKRIAAERSLGYMRYPGISFSRLVRR